MRSFLFLFLCIQQLIPSTAFTSTGRIFGKSRSIFLSGKVKADDSGIDVYISAITSLTDDLEEKDKLLTEAREEIKSLEKILEQKGDQGEQMNEFYPIFSAQMEEKCAEIEELKKKLNEANRLVGKMEAKDDEIGQLEEVIKDYEDQQSLSLQVIDAKDLEIKELNDQVVKLDEDMKVMSKKHNDLITKYDEKKSLSLQKIDAKSKEIEELNDVIKDYEDQQSLSLQVVDAKDLEIKELNDQVVKLDEDMEVMNKKHNDLITKYDEKKSLSLQKIDAKSKEIEELNDQIDDLGKEMKSMERQHYIEYGTLKNEMQLEIETSKEEIIKLQNRNKELELENKKYKEEEKQYKKVRPLASHQKRILNETPRQTTWTPSDVIKP